MPADAPVMDGPNSSETFECGCNISTIEREGRLPQLVIAACPDLQCDVYTTAVAQMELRGVPVTYIDI